MRSFDYATAARMYKAGRLIRDIAAEFNVTGGAVVYALDREMGRRRPVQERNTDRKLLALPEAQPIIRRLSEAVDPDSPIDVMEHIRLIAANVIRAKKHPRNPYAEPTL